MQVFIWFSVLIACTCSLVGPSWENSPNEKIFGYYSDKIQKRFNSVTYASKCHGFCYHADNSLHCRLNFYSGKNEIYHQSSKEHHKISKFAKFGCETL